MASLSNTILGRAIDGLTAWFAHRRDIGELSRLSRADFASIASDLRLSPLDLARLARQRNRQRRQPEPVCSARSELIVRQSPAPNRRSCETWNAYAPPVRIRLSVGVRFVPARRAGRIGNSAQTAALLTASIVKKRRRQ